MYELFCKDISDGLTLTAIAKKHKLSLTTAHRKLHSFGLKATRRKHYLKGKKYGRLEVISECEGKYALWNCQCDCGNVVVVRAEHLLDGSTRSCGCLSHDLRWTGYGEISGDYWCRVKKGAVCRKIEITITIEDAWQQFLAQHRICVLSGLPLVFASNFKDKSQEQTASLDRKDSNIGYTVANIQWVHKTVQLMKNKLDEDVFLDFCERITCQRTKTVLETA